MLLTACSINLVRHLDANFKCRHFSHSPLLRLRVRFQSFFRGALLLNFNKMLESEILITIVQQHEENFIIACMNLSAWLNTVYWTLGQMTLIVENKSRWCKSEWLYLKGKVVPVYATKQMRYSSMHSQPQHRWKWSAWHLGLFKLQEKAPSNH